MNVHRSALSDEDGATTLGFTGLDTFLAENPEVQYVDCVFADLCAIVRGKRVARAEVERVFANGLPIPYSIYFLDARGDVADPMARGLADGPPEGLAWPVAGTLTRVNWSQRPHAQVLMTLRDAKDAPYFGEPRNVLKRVVERFAKLSSVPSIGADLQFFLLDRERTKTGAPEAPSLDNQDHFQEVVDAITDAAAIQRLPALKITERDAPGQYEIKVELGRDIVRAADHAVFLRQIVRAVARQHEFDATFMPKPFLALPGSGMNVRVALSDAGGKDQLEGESQALKYAIGGIQTVLAESMAIFAPNQNAHRRFAPSSFVPRNKRWSQDGSATNIAVATDTIRTIEHRMAGADANPYLVFAAILSGIHYGMSEEIEASQPAQGNATTFVDQTIPFNIDGALLALENGSIMREYLGRTYVDLFCATKRAELDRFRNYITAHEYDWYM